VAEVIDFIQRLDATGEAAMIETARSLRVADRLVRAAVDHYTDFSDEIDGEIERREREAERERARWERRQLLLA